MTETPRADAGRFVWHDLMTEDVKAAKAFYTELFGWTVKTMEIEGVGEYEMLEVDGVGIGGLVPLDPKDDLPSHWMPYVTVPDVEEAVRQAEQLGGDAPVPATEIRDIGTFSVVVDPSGALISPFRFAGESGPEGPETSPPGGFTWHRLVTPDPVAAERFYGELFGWGFEEVELGEEDRPHSLFRRGDEDVAGVVLPREPEGPAYWLSYIAVEEVDGTASRLEKLGGEMTVAPDDIPGMGRFAVCTDPVGAAFAMFAASVPMPEAEGRE